MKTNLFNARHHAPVGPGGWRCPCCRPQRSAKRIVARAHKKQLYRMFVRLERE